MILNKKLYTLKDILFLVRNDDFKRIDQFHKRDLIGDNILTKDICTIGIDVLCYDLEAYCDKKNRYFYNKQTTHTTKYLTIGKFYKVINQKEDKIKIINDKGHKKWYHMRRFIYSLRLERRDKIKKINNNYENFKKK